MRARGSGPFEPSDIELLTASLNEYPYKTAAFGKLVARYETRVFRTCLFIVRHAEDAEDITQEVFIRALSHLRDVRGESFAPWLFRIAKNACLNHLKRHSTRKAMVEPHAHDFSEHSDAGAGHLDVEVNRRMLVQRALARMPGEAQEILSLRFGAGLSIVELGRVMGTSTSATKMRLYRAMERFKKEYLSCTQMQ